MNHFFLQPMLAWMDLTPFSWSALIAVFLAALMWFMAEEHEENLIFIFYCAIILFALFLFFSPSPLGVLVPFQFMQSRFRYYDPTLGEMIGNWILYATGLILSLKLMPYHPKQGITFSSVFALMIATDLVLLFRALVF